jgi:hypothetical protein
MIIEAKIEFVKHDPNGEPFHVYKREKGFLFFKEPWVQSQRLKTLPEAEEKVKSLGDTVDYLGIYENGKRKGVTDWNDPAWDEIKKVREEKTKPMDLPDTEQVHWDNRMRRK